MSELKPYIGPHPTDRTLTEFYLKSEADKVIAELEDKLKNVSVILKETREWLMESQKLHKRCADNAVKEIHYQKYKRCLAMARWCRTSARCDEGLGAFKYRDWYWKWLKRWLELAEKFKEAK